MQTLAFPYLLLFLIGCPRSSQGSSWG